MTPAALAAGRRRAANSAGGRSPGGSVHPGRARRCTASTTVSARAAAALTARSRAAPEITAMNDSTGALGPVQARHPVGAERVGAEQRPLGDPGCVLSGSPRASTRPTFAVPARARTAAPAARRSDSSSYVGVLPFLAPAALPRPTATTMGAVVAPSEDSLVTSFGLPVSPSAVDRRGELALEGLVDVLRPGQPGRHRPVSSRRRRRGRRPSAALGVAQVTVVTVSRCFDCALPSCSRWSDSWVGLSARSAGDAERPADERPSA